MTQQIITASAPGKIHFMGEHTAVYGTPALLAAIDKRCHVSLKATDSQSVIIRLSDTNEIREFSFAEIIQLTKNAQILWKQYREVGDIALLKKIIYGPIMYPVMAIGETLLYCKAKPKTGFTLEIKSEILIGSGLGSSAAVAASVVAAVMKWLGQSFDDHVIRNIAIQVEQKQHGNPSYGDVSTVIQGGLLWFQKRSSQDIVCKPLDVSVSKDFAKKLFAIQSGIPKESTGEMIHVVSEFKRNHPEIFSQICKEQTQLVEELVSCLKTESENALLTIIQKGEKNLEKLGVVSESTKKLIQEIEKAGGAAKICGAGGSAHSSGIILAFHKEPVKIKSLIRKAKKDYFSFEIDQKGITVS